MYIASRQYRAGDVREKKSNFLSISCMSKAMSSKTNYESGLLKQTGTVPVTGIARYKYSTCNRYVCLVSLSSMPEK